LVIQLLSNKSLSQIITVPEKIPTFAGLVILHPNDCIPEQRFYWLEEIIRTPEETILKSAV